MSFTGLWDTLLPIGRDHSTGGYRRFAWTAEDEQCRAWFRHSAAERNLRTHCDRNANLWAWWDSPEAPDGAAAVVTGSHLDSVPDGGAFDGPLGVVSSFAAIDLLRARGFAPTRPVAVVACCDEEGARFGVACAGSRLITGKLDPGKARMLTDSNGVTLAAAME